MHVIHFSKNREVYIDQDDVNAANMYQWHITNYKDRFYVRAFYKENGKKKSVFLQHLIVGRAPRGKRLFFKDGNSLNLQKQNLEFISCCEFSHRVYQKKKPNRNAIENFRGVIVQYIARIKINNKVTILGSFSNEADAANAYNTKARELYGERAVLNLL